jgi:NADPH-dependent curcumin reductase CurA
MMKGREIRLAARPQGWPTAETFDLVETEVPEPGPDQVLVRNIAMSVDPYMRGRMNDTPSYVPPFQVGAVLEGGAVGEVVASRSDGLAVGDVVLHAYGWRDYAVADADRFRRVDTSVAAPSAYLGVLGMPGLTAYVGLLDIAAMKAGDSVFVSGAAGAVGALVGQIAKLRGATRVVGSAGSADKVAYLTDRLGFDAAFNYKDAPVRDQLKVAAPDGIDVYFDNVGGEHLEAAIGRLNPYGRVALCGAISQYNSATPVAGPGNLAMAIGKRLMLRGFIVSDHMHRTPELVTEVGAWLAAGQILADESTVDGLERAPEAFLGMLRGENTGKMVVRLHAA